MPRRYIITGILVVVLQQCPTSHAQYTANFQTNLINGVSSNWTGAYIVGSNTYADVLRVQPSGQLDVSGSAVLGYEIDSSNNLAVVSGSNSRWTTTGGDFIGISGAGNRLVISNGGTVNNSSSNCYVGYYASSSNNSILITSTGSVWKTGFGLGGLFFGYAGPNNSLTISNRALLFSGNSAYVGHEVGSDNNTILVTGTGTYWNVVGMYLGYAGAGNSLVINNGAQVTNAEVYWSYMGYLAGSSNNSVLVTDPGSVWDSGGDTHIGHSGVGNSLVISNGGRVISHSGYQSLVGAISSRNNSVLITGTGSTWQCDSANMVLGSSSSSNSLVVCNGGIFNRGTFGYSLYVNGQYNSLVISNGGQVLASSVSVGGWSNNSVLVTGAGSVCSNVVLSGNANSLVISNGGQILVALNTGASVGADHGSARVVDGGIWQSGTLTVGIQGSGNSLVVDGGSVSATNLVVGYASSNCDNLVELDSGSVVVTNHSHTAVLDVRNGSLIVNGGTLQIDLLVITNSCASFLHTGGSVIAASVVLPPNSFQITSVARQGNDILITFLLGPGITNVLQVTSGDANGGYVTNGFSDIFIVTNNPTAGTVTNYLDMGAATNWPARYYRVRLTP